MKSSELVRLLKKDGWFVIRQTGSHEVGKGLEKKIKKDAGIK
ncbi:MAG: type II toxin-antitoxin system HicA family toxin [Ferruginibacter sp.]|nr:type II toxin-antitoxin system HicA family toxin [Ferruginibacter sp.]